MERPDPTRYIAVAEIEITAVRPGPTGFVLEGRGADAGDYRLDMVLEMPVDPRTRSVLGGILAQSEWRIWRRATQPLKRLAARRPPARRRLGGGDSDG